jgi:hypothetical protein
VDVTIGDGNVIGLREHLTKDTKIPPGTHLLGPAGMDPHRVYEHKHEHGHGTRER